jgi:hypothetical protein
VPRTQSILTTAPECAGEFPATATDLPVVQGAFDYEFASLREAISPLRMTGRLIHIFTGDKCCNS